MLPAERGDEVTTVGVLQQQKFVNVEVGRRGDERSNLCLEDLLVIWRLLDLKT